ncbi:MAG TPA: DedA family protein [Iamia sp.]|nr:DedA family protein [Iamia sp.]
MFEWIEALTHLAEAPMAGPWLYLGLFALAAVDGVVPAVPSESAVISVGVIAATGDADLALVIAAGGLGALAGDHLAYALGRGLGGRLDRPGVRRTRRRVALERAQDLLRRRGPALLVVSRYIPGGRTATTLAAGSVRLRLRTFTAVTALAGATWASTSALIGFLGGRAFEERPLAGIAVGIGASLVLAGAVEAVQRARAGRAHPIG